MNVASKPISVGYGRAVRFTQVLTNEKYVGNNVYNRVSFKLKKKRVANPADIWIRAVGAFEPIVSRDLCEAAQGTTKGRTAASLTARPTSLLRRVREGREKKSANRSRSQDGRAQRHVMQAKRHGSWR